MKLRGAVSGSDAYFILENINIRICVIETILSQVLSGKIETATQVQDKFEPYGLKELVCSKKLVCILRYGLIEFKRLL